MKKDFIIRVMLVGATACLIALAIVVLQRRGRCKMYLSSVKRAIATEVSIAAGNPFTNINNTIRLLPLNEWKSSPSINIKTLHLSNGEAVTLTPFGKLNVSIQHTSNGNSIVLLCIEGVAVCDELTLPLQSPIK